MIGSEIALISTTVEPIVTVPASVPCTVMIGWAGKLVPLCSFPAVWKQTGNSPFFRNDCGAQSK